MSMQMLKDAIVTTATVLAVIYVVRQFKAGENLVDTAISG